MTNFPIIFYMTLLIKHWRVWLATQATVAFLTVPRLKAPASKYRDILLWSGSAPDNQCMAQVHPFLINKKETNWGRWCEVAHVALLEHLLDLLLYCYVVSQAKGNRFWSKEQLYLGADLSHSPKGGFGFTEHHGKILACLRDVFNTWRQESCRQCFQQNMYHMMNLFCKKSLDCNVAGKKIWEVLTDQW